MKLFEILSPIIKSILSVVAFLIGLGWAAYSSVYLIVKAEGKVIKEEVKQIRSIDMEHINKRFDRIEVLIKEK